MRLILLLLIFVIPEIGLSQEVNSKVIGEWFITDVNYKSKIIICITTVESPAMESPVEIQTRLQRDYIGASIEFLNTQQLIYRDKNGRLEKEGNAKFFTVLGNYKWQQIYDDEIELIHLEDNDVAFTLLIQKEDETMSLDFIGIVFTLKRERNSSIKY